MRVTVRPELETADRATEVPMIWEGIAAKLIVCVCKTNPVPLSAAVCVDPDMSRLLSVKTADPVMAPPVLGLKSMLRLQLAPTSNEAPAAQSIGVPEPAVCRKFELTLSPDKVSLALPMF